MGSKLLKPFYDALSMNTKPKRTFASDNYTGVHLEILEAINSANVGHQSAYGNDEYTKTAVRKFKQHFGDHSEVYFVYNGTAANVLGIGAILKSFNSVICTEQSHINKHECGAPEKFSGCKLIPIVAADAKLTVNIIIDCLNWIDEQDQAQPRVISITQATEFGTVYTSKEVYELAEFAHKNGMLLHVDGARISNAAAHLEVDLKESVSGADVISFGGTKNGMMFGEAVIFTNKELSRNFKYIRKQGTQLH